MRKHLIILINFCLITSAAITFPAIVQASENSFDREAALKKYKDSCSDQLILAMGLAAQKESGMSKQELETIAANSKAPVVMNLMVEELHNSPSVQGRTYTFFKYDNCIISKATSKPAVSFNSVHKALIDCESKHQSMEILIECIDHVIVEKNR